MKRRDILKIMLGSLAQFVVPVKADAQLLFSQNSFVDLCNLAISHEYGAIVQYINHAGLIKEEKVKKVLLANMQDEIYHARRITEILIKEGATPTVTIWPPQTGKKLKILLEEDISGEEAAIRLYQKILDLKESAKYRKDFNFFLNREIVHRGRLVRLIDETAT